MKPERQKGYALTDALIAAIIAASVAVVVAQSLGVAARSIRTSKELNVVVQEAEIITSRLNAGMPQDKLITDLPDWKITASPYEIILDGKELDDTDFTLITLTHSGPPSFSFDRIIITEGGA